MLSSGLLTGLMESLRRPNFTQISIRILYHLSQNVEHRRMMAFTSIPLHIVSLLLKTNKKQVDKEIMALAINLSLEPRCAEAICFASTGDGNSDVFHQLMKKAHTTLDIYMLKMLRNISSHGPPLRDLFRRYLHELVSMVVHQQNSPDSHDILVEILGILSPLNLPDVPWGDIISQGGLIEFAIRILTPGVAEDDIILELVILIGCWSSDPSASVLLAHPGLIRTLQLVLVGLRFVCSI